MFKTMSKPTDPYSLEWTAYWEENPESNRGVGADGVNDGDDNKGTGDNDNDDNSNNDGDNKGGNANDDDNDNDNKGKSNTPSDAEAKLLKEVMSKKATLKLQTDEIEKLKSDLGKFDGIDLEEVRKLIQTQKDAKTTELEKKGEWDKLRQQMVEQQNKDKGELTTEIEKLKSKLSGKDTTINNLTVGHSFDASGYIGDKLTLTSSKARIIYGSHFDVEDGSVIAYDKTVGTDGRTMLVDGEGKPLGFEAAIAKIVDADPDRDHIVRSQAKPGGDSKPGGGKTKEIKIELKGASKIEAALNSSK